jgi:hypothetical protein
MSKLQRELITLNKGLAHAPKGEAVWVFLNPQWICKAPVFPTVVNDTIRVLIQTHHEKVWLAVDFG